MGLIVIPHYQKIELENSGNGFYEIKNLENFEIPRS